MTAQPTKRRGVAWALAAGAVGLSVGLGGGVLLPGLALADDGSTKTFGRATLEADRELVVPAGTCGVTWTLVGGFGGNGLDDAVGGAPGHVVATTTVTAGQTYRIGVGQPGSAADLDTETDATAGGASTVTLHTEDSDEVVLGAGGGNAASAGHEANVVGVGIPSDAVATNGTFAGTSAEGSVVTAELVACPPVVAPQLVSAAESQDAPGTVLVTFQPGGDEAGTPATSYEVSTDGGQIWEPLASLQGDGTSASPYVGQITRAAGEYQVVVQGVSADGRYSAASAPQSVTVVGPVVGGDGGGGNGGGGNGGGEGDEQVAPTAPTIEKAVSNQPGEVDFDIIPGEGGLAPTHYEYSIQGVDGPWNTLNWTSSVDGVVLAKVTELTEGTEYTFHVRAVVGGDPQLLSEVSQPKTVLVKSSVSTPVGDEPVEPTPVGNEPVKPTPVGDEPVEPTPVGDEPAPPVVTPPVTPAPDADRPRVENVPTVPTTVPADAPLSLKTDKAGQTTAAPGEKITVLGTGFMPNSNATVIIYSEPRVLGTVTTDENGSFRLEVVIPADLPAGEHSLVASGIAPDGSERFIRMNVTVDADGNATIDGNGDEVDDTLAYTGAEPLVPALLGAGALVGGGALLFVSRRRRTAQV
jgi:LPXTG-motif cell wall-anchored protein